MANQAWLRDYNKQMSRKPWYEQVVTSPVNGMLNFTDLFMPKEQSTPQEMSNQIRKEMSNVQEANKSAQSMNDINSLQSQYLTDTIANLQKQYGGGVSAQPMIDAYRQAANSQIDTTKQAYSSSRADLLKSIERFREDTAMTKKEQAQDFNANKAALEEQAFMAQRANKASAAARGISGSGLQALGSVQSQIATGQELSNLANTNQRVLDGLRSKLERAQGDYTQQNLNLTKEEANALNAIQATLSGNIAQANYKAQQDALSNQMNLSNLIGQKQELYNTGSRAINATVSSFNDIINANTKKGKASKKAIDEAKGLALADLDTAYYQGGISDAAYAKAKDMINQNYTKAYSKL